MKIICRAGSLWRAKNTATTLNEAVYVLGRRTAIWHDLNWLNRLEEWVHRNLMNFNEEK